MRLILIFISIGLFTPALHAQTMQPGLWKAKSVFTVIGLDLPASEDQECVTAEQAKDVKGTLTKELKKSNCQITRWDLKKEKLEATVECAGKDLKAQGTLRGTVKPKSYDLQGDAEGSFKNLPAQAQLKLTGQWVGRCGSSAGR